MDTTATLEYLRRSARYAIEKPYSINHTVAGWEGNTARSNYEGYRVDYVPILDIRTREYSLSFDSHGFAVLPFETSLRYEEFASPKSIREVYAPQIASSVLNYFGAAKVHILDLEVRRRDARFPHVTMQQAQAVQPAARVHVDLSSRAAAETLEHVEGAEFQCKRHIFVNAWKPLRGPLRDWPLALCNPQTVDPAIDLELHDVVDSNAVQENLMVYHNNDHCWYYLSEQLSTELLIFRQADSKGSIGVPHAAFELSAGPYSPEIQLRESIEVRILLCFDS